MPGRRYHSPRRVEAAAATRQSILDAAKELFATHGYVATTVTRIAAAARVGTNTVYTSTGGKPQILRELVTASVEDPIAERTLARVAAAGDAHDVVAYAVEGIRRDSEKHAVVIEILLDAASVDAHAAEVLHFAQERFRDALRTIADRLAALGALPEGLDAAGATDVLWYYLGLSSWRVLVRENGWDWDTAERWLRNRTVAALLTG
ncbi:TetR/AcrR family transcriptional regulator [Streptomyces sp. TRM 70361]|uniref:TetR/AcrR family transcriptional regulator n=1 Tax=Streptomyces sp. TRM 70361 TaxID=3116553 RepID=UPI002E7B47FC|nr:TetR/AcrR family transcriptional regulator [Streptomyces sp. TRM 70361]MEE1941309.1 TetR/AcrR family transcriptional regulator [Streptomyces sp. TRM 70361]